MKAAEIQSPLPGSHADDQEIKRYAALLDRLGIGMLVFSPDATPVFQNELAGKLLGDAPHTWADESGQPVVIEDITKMLAHEAGTPIFQYVLALTNADLQTTWLSINLFPVFAENGSVRRIVLTLTDIDEERKLQSEIKKLTTRDPLTGVFNQRQVMYLLENEIHRARRYGTPFTLAQLDIDLFIPFCEKHGQKTGDSVLAGIGKLLLESMREIDIAGRIGNDEFLLVLPNVSLKDALVGLERLRVLIETETFTDDFLRVTVSGGITEYTGENSATLIERSKSLLINARESGRNRFCLDGDIL